MKVLFIPSGYPNEVYPMSNTFLQEQVMALAKSGHYIILLNVAQKGIRKKKGKLEKKITITYPGQNIVEYRTWIYTCLQERLPNLYVARCEKALYKLFNKAFSIEGRPDIIYAHFGFYAGYIASKIGKQYDIPVVVQEHYSYLMGTNTSPSIIGYIGAAIHNSELYSCVSNNLRKSIISKINLSYEDINKLIVIENMLNNKFVFSKLEDNKKFIFLSVGNMNPRKNFRLLVEAFCLAFKPDDNVELRLGGDGEEREKLMHFVADMNRNNQIVFLGALSREEVYEENRKSHCFALMSQKETFGIVYREALAVGRPIITSNHGGFDEPIDSRDGIQVNSFDAQEVAKAMRFIKDNYAMYDLHQISNRCLSQYSEEVIIKKIVNALENAIERHRNDRHF